MLVSVLTLVEIKPVACSIQSQLIMHGQRNNKFHPNMRRCGSQRGQVLCRKLQRDNPLGCRPTPRDISSQKGLNYLRKLLTIVK